MTGRHGAVMPLMYNFPTFFQKSKQSFRFLMYFTTSPFRREVATSLYSGTVALNFAPTFKVRYRLPSELITILSTKFSIMLLSSASICCNDDNCFLASSNCSFICLSSLVPPSYLDNFIFISFICSLMTESF